MEKGNRYIIEHCSYSRYPNRSEVYCMEVSEKFIKLKFLDHPDKRTEWIPKSDIKKDTHNLNGIVIVENLGFYNYSY